MVGKHPGRSDYLDTMSVLYRSLGNAKQSRSYAEKALLFGGDDGYMHWQANVDKWSQSATKTIKDSAVD